MKARNIVAILILIVLSFTFTACNNSVADYEVEYNLSINSTDVQLEKGQTYQLVAKYGEYDVEYSCENTDVISLSKTGLITAVDFGVAYVKITVNGVSGVERFCKVTVQDNVYEVKFVMGNNFAVNINTERVLEVATYKNGVEYACQVEWKIDQPNARLTVDGNTAIFISDTVGEYTVTVTSADGARTEIVINVVDGFDE